VSSQDCLKTVPGTEQESSMQFHQGMVDRMALSYYKYGPVAKANINAIESLQLRLKKYAETGNTEFLMDAANFAMMEFMRPSHPDAFFEPTDSNQSPGRIGADGRDIGQTANTAGHENVRLGGSHLRTDGGFYRREGD
jgi:hypothetical protein